MHECQSFLIYSCNQYELAWFIRIVEILFYEELSYQYLILHVVHFLSCCQFNRSSQNRSLQNEFRTKKQKVHLTISRKISNEFFYQWTACFISFDRKIFKMSKSLSNLHCVERCSQVPMLQLLLLMDQILLDRQPMHRVLHNQSLIEPIVVNA